MIWQPEVSFNDFLAKHHLTLRCHEVADRYHEEVNGNLAEIFGPTALQAPNKDFNLKGLLENWCYGKLRVHLRREWFEANGLYVGVFIKTKSHPNRCYRLLRFIPEHESAYTSLQLERIDKKELERKDLISIGHEDIVEIFQDDPTPVRIQSEPVAVQPLNREFNPLINNGAFPVWTRAVRAGFPTGSAVYDPLDLLSWETSVADHDDRWRRRRQELITEATRREILFRERQGETLRERQGEALRVPFPPPAGWALAQLGESLTTAPDPQPIPTTAPTETVVPS